MQSLKEDHVSRVGTTATWFEAAHFEELSARVSKALKLAESSSRLSHSMLTVELPFQFP